MPDPETKTPDEVDDVQANFDAAGFGHWTITPQHGVSGDLRAYFRAERVAPNGKREVTHREGRVLLELAREVDARFGAPEAVAVVAGVLDTHNTGG